MPLLFSYGSLQRAEIQQATFGRFLDGTRDELVGWRLVPPSAGLLHANLSRASVASRVAGMAFEVADSELAAADAYEQRDGYVRVEARLLSGRSTWVYVDGSSMMNSRG